MVNFSRTTNKLKYFIDNCCVPNSDPICLHGFRRYGNIVVWFNILKWSLLNPIVALYRLST